MHIRRWVVAAVVVCLLGTGLRAADDGARQGAVPATERFEGADEAALAKSFDAIVRRLEPAKAADTEKALGIIAAQQMLKHPREGGASALAKMKQETMAMIRGKTADEVIALANGIAKSDPAAAQAAAQIELRSHILALHSVLQIARTKIELYKLEHLGEPDFQRYGNWEQLLGKTDEEGTLGAEGKFGPYLSQVPYNPFRRSSRVIVVNAPAARALQQAVTQGDCGWIMTGDRQLLALNAVGMPIDPAALEADARAMEGAPSMEAKRAAAMSILQTLRSQVELYRLQHQAQAPDFAGPHPWRQLLGKTDEGGQVGENAKYGPYLLNEPMNPLREASGVMVVRGEVDRSRPIQDKKIGWVVQKREGGEARVYAVDETGRVIKE